MLIEPMVLLILFSDPEMKLEKVNPKTGRGVVECIRVDRKELKFQILFERPEKVEMGGNADLTINDTLDVQTECLTREEVLTQLRAVKVRGSTWTGTCRPLAPCRPCECLCYCLCSWLRCCWG